MSAIVLKMRREIMETTAERLRSANANFRKKDLRVWKALGRPSAGQ